MLNALILTPEQFEEQTRVEGSLDETLLRTLFLSPLFPEGGSGTPAFSARLAALLDSGANPNAKIHHDGSISSQLRVLNGSSALAVAVHYGDADAARLLLAAGADPNGLDNDGNLILHEAMRRCPQLVDELIDAGADIHLRSRWDSAFTRAAKQGMVGLCDRLLAAGANIHDRDGEGYSALSCAVLFHRLDVAFLLMIRGIGSAAIEQALPGAREIDRSMGRAGILSSALQAGLRIKRFNRRAPIDAQEIFAEMEQAGASALCVTAEVWASVGDDSRAYKDILESWLNFELSTAGFDPGLAKPILSLEMKNGAGFPQALAAVEAADLRNHIDACAGGQSSSPDGSSSATSPGVAGEGCGAQPPTARKPLRV